MDWANLLLGVLNAVLLQLGSQELCWAPAASDGPSPIILEPTRASFFNAPTPTSTATSSAAGEMPFGYHIFLGFFSGSCLIVLLPVILLAFLSFWYRIEQSISTASTQTGRQYVDAGTDSTTPGSRPINSTTQTTSVYANAETDSPTPGSRPTNATTQTMPEDVDEAAGANSIGNSYVNKDTETDPTPPGNSYVNKDTETDPTPSTIELDTLFTIANIIRDGQLGLMQAAENALTNNGKTLKDDYWIRGPVGGFNTADAHKFHTLRLLEPHLQGIDAGLGPFFRQLVGSLTDGPYYKTVWKFRKHRSSSEVQRENDRLSQVLKQYYQARFRAIWKGEEAVEGFFGSDVWEQHVQTEKDAKANEVKRKVEGRVGSLFEVVAEYGVQTWGLKREVETLKTAAEMARGPMRSLTDATGGEETMETRAMAPIEVEAEIGKGKAKMVCKRPPTPAKTQPEQEKKEGNLRAEAPNFQPKTNGLQASRFAPR